MNFLKLFILVLLLPALAFGQRAATISGVIQDQYKRPVADANVIVLGIRTGTISDKKGRFSLTVPSNHDITLKFSHVKYFGKSLTFNLSEGENKQIRLTMKSRTLNQFTLEYIDPGTGNLDEYDIILPSEMTSVNGGVEGTLKFGNYGVSQTSELSAGYNVRGGNFNENLIYVNDIQVYRPFLARSGQQEGLSFVNPYLINNILFSSGGFDARYGDKLSSVLDIRYTEPTIKDTTLNGSFTASLLGVSSHIEKYVSPRFNYISGLRYRTNSYLLGALDTQGEYKPTSIDYQGMFNYHLNETTKLSFFGTYSKNDYRVIPENRETNFGSINQALRFTVFYEGQEVTAFETYMGAVSLQHEFSDSLKMKFITSVYRTQESEHFDLLGEYRLDELERDLGNDQYGEVAFNRGVGAFLDHARNDLDATVANAYTKWTYNVNQHKLEWGAKFQHEIINDQISEWNYVDSSRFNIPHPQDSVGYVDPSAQPYQYLTLSNVIKSKNNISSNRITGYIQDRKSFQFPTKIYFEDSIITKDTAYLYRDTIETAKSINATLGVRAHYWGFNGQTVVSPRFSINYRPARFYLHNNEAYRRNLLFRFATGYYYQPAFYRELRNLQGEINPEIRAQKSLHFVLGMDYTYFMWGRPFKFGTEVYYKHLSDLIPYEIDNVRIRYYGENNAVGYATGVDMKLNGEFIKGVESYASLSWLKTEEDILDDYYYDYFNSDGEQIYFGYTSNDVVVDSVRHEPGNIPRPTDQRVSFATFFQDRMPKEWDTDKFKFSTMKVNLTMVFGSRLPYGPPGEDRYKDILRSSLYKRVDIGFSKELFTDQTKLKDGSIWKKMDKVWISFEVFNLLDISNTINYSWIKDVTGRQYSIPSFLTSRRLNLKFVAQF